MTTVGVLQPRGHQRPQDRPILYWSERRGSWWPGVSRRCPVCQGALYGTPPTMSTWQGVTPGRIACQMCGRDWADVLDVRRRTPTPAELAREGAPKRGRPPKDKPITLPKRARKLCPDCGTVRLSQKAARCLGCRRRAREEGALSARLVLALSDHRPWSVSALCVLLGITPASLRHVIRRARLRGCVIRRAAKRSYVMETAP